MERQIYTAEHEAFRDTVRTFLAKEVLPHYEQWEKDGITSRGAWLAAGRQGLLGLAVDEEYGGGGTPTSATARSSARSSPVPACPASPSACTTTSSARTSPASPPRSRSAAGCRASARARPSPPSR